MLTHGAVQFATAKTYAFSHSLQCLGGISGEPVKAWESRIKWFLETHYPKYLDRIDGGPIEFEWTKFPRIHYIGNSRRDSKVMTELQCEHEQFKGRITSSCQYTLTLVGENEETEKIVLRMLPELLSMLEDSRKDTGRFWGLDPRRNCTEPIATNRIENGIKLLKA